MKKINKKAVLNLGVVAMLLLVGVALVEAMQGNSVLTCAAPGIGMRTCTATDPNGTVEVKVWSMDTHKEVVNVQNHHFAPTAQDITIPWPGNFTIELKDNEKDHAKDFWIVNSTGIFGPFAKKPTVKVEIKTEGEGRINSTVMPNASTFEFEAKNKNGDVKGELQYQDKGAGIKLHANVTMLEVNKTAMPRTADFSGIARVTNATGAKMDLPYEVHVWAGGKGVGRLNLTISPVTGFLPSGYMDNDKLLRGEIKVDP